MTEIQSIYSSYSRIIDKYGQQAIENTISNLTVEIDKFIENLPDRMKGLVYFQPTILAHAVCDYYTDTFRLQQFHKIDTINQIKKISYECYWLLRRKPIQISDKYNLDDVGCFLNEKFVVTRIANHFYNNCNMNGLYVENNNKIVNNFLESLYYFLKFRHYDAQVLEMIIMSFYAGNCLIIDTE